MIVDELWDVVVIGAGPAGAVAAYLLAAPNRKVLLLDRKKFPREKVCGGCLNRRALATLRRIDLAADLEKLKAIPLEQFELSAYTQRLSLPLSESVSVSRLAWDASLVDAAGARGVVFRAETQARLGKSLADSREVNLLQGEKSQTIRAKIVIVADGLGGTALTGTDEFSTRVATDSRVGAGAAFSAAGLESYRSGTLYMVVEREGYVGLVRNEEGKLNVAAALEKKFLQSETKIENAINSLLTRSGFSALPSPDAPWLGTPALTRHLNHFGGTRVFVIGDAAAYVEPFTGEGMAWALAGAEAVVPFAVAGMTNWREDLASEWNRQYRKTLSSRQRICRAVTFGLRQPKLARAGVKLLSHFPRLAQGLH